MSELKDLTGQRFGRLVVIARAENSHAGQARWLCACDCGGKSVSVGSALRSGRATSCGCLRREKLLLANTKHGGSDSHLYHVWCDMKRRCQDEHGKDWENYGGRGIEVCDEWKNDYVSFQRWALENGYSQGLTIDRIDVNKGYSPDNCRWADAVTQSRNRRNVHIITYNGKSQTLSAWAAEYNIPYEVLYYRCQRGWPIERALNKPIRVVNKKK